MEREGIRSQPAEPIHLSVGVWEASRFELFEAGECEISAEVCVVETSTNMGCFGDFDCEGAAGVLSQGASQEWELVEDSTESTGEVRIVLERVVALCEREEESRRWVYSCAQVLNGRAWDICCLHWKGWLDPR